MNGKRWWNFSSLKKYIDEINKNGNAVAGSEMITEEQKLDEYVMLALRSSGLNMNEFKENFDESWIKEKYDYFIQLKDQNLLSINVI